MAELYLKQLLVGRDIGKDDAVGKQIQNFVYLIGDRTAGECLVIDPAWVIQDVLDCAAADDMKIVGALATHYHPDHVGGTMFGFTVQGLPTLQELNPCKVHCHKLEAEGIRTVTGLSASDFVEHESNDVVKVGEIEVELLHTPGHTPGSSCFRVKQNLLAGDTLFLQGCGRVDLPGGDPEQMRITLTQRLAKLRDDLELYPGHAYGGEHASLGHVKQTNLSMQ